MKAETERLARSLREHGIEGAEVMLVLGSGLGAFVERLERARHVSAADLEGLPHSGVPGHAGALVAGELGGARVLVQQGRVHLYEGWSGEQVTRAVRTSAALGARALLLTNAAGGIRAGFRPGTLMRIRDHIDLQHGLPLARGQRASGVLWDEELGRALERAALDAGLALESGTYAGLPGPAYETPAEIRWLASLGADAVGMSTVAEALAGRASGLRVAGISCITNLAAGLAPEPPSHAEVLEAGRRSAGELGAVLARALPLLAVAVRGG